MSPRSTLDDDGRVYLVEPEAEDADGRITAIGHVGDDARCPGGMELAWAELAARWREEVEDARAERALRRAEYDEAIGGFRG